MKTVGYLLLSVGIFSIIFSTVSLYEAYSGHKKVPQVINQQGIVVDLSGFQNLGQLSDVNSSADSNRLELFSAQTVNTSLNLLFYFIAMSFIAGSGFKIAGLGVQLLRPVNIHSSVLS